MSIIFSAFPKPEVTSYSNLYWCEKEETTFVSKEEAQDQAKLHSATCADCKSYGGVLEKENLFVDEVQMSNSNAYAFLEALGLPSEYAGEVDANLFFDRITLLNLDSSHLLATDQKLGNVFSFGRNRDYIEKRLSQLSTLSTWARANNATITWG